MSKQGHHWIGCTPDPARYFGFIYVITDLTTGKRYVGKKQYWMSRRAKGCKSKVTDKQSPRWKPTCWLPSDWQYYKGSSKNLHAYMEEHPKHKYEYRIVRQCRARGTLHYAEIEAIIRTGALWVRDVSGEPVFFNRQVPACRFRPQAFYGTEEKWLVPLEDLDKQ